MADNTKTRTTDGWYEVEYVVALVSNVMHDNYVQKNDW